MLFFFNKLKRNIIPIFFCVLIFLLLIFSKSTLKSSKAGLLLWANNIVPSLFCFFVATELLNKTKIPIIIGKMFYKLMLPIFNVPGEGAYALIMGSICGYPTGAKIVSDFYSNNIFTKSEAERLLAFSNNSGPLFIVGTVGICFFCSIEIGFLLLFTHLLSCITVGILLGLVSRFFCKEPSTNSKIIQKKIPQCSFFNLGELLGNSILSATRTVFIIGGFVVLFSVLISILNNLYVFDFLGSFFSRFGFDKNYVVSFFSGIVELTNGINLVSCIRAKNISANIILCAFLIGFGGFSILLQIFSICSTNKLHIKYYFIGKLIQGILAALYTFLILNSNITYFISY